MMAIKWSRIFLVFPTSFLLTVSICGPLAAHENVAQENAAQENAAQENAATDNETYFREFFDEVASGKTVGLIRKMDPRLQVLIDEPVLAMLFDCINQNLGPLKSFEIASTDSEGRRPMEHWF